MFYYKITIEDDKDASSTRDKLHDISEKLITSSGKTAKIALASLDESDSLADIYYLAAPIDDLIKPIAEIFNGEACIQPPFSETVTVDIGFEDSTAFFPAKKPSE